MYKEFDFPISVEEFAAYLDGNLTEDGMARVTSIIHNDSSMRELAEASQLVTDTMDSYSTMDLDLPEEIANLDFDLPEIKNVDIFTAVADSLVENDHLYNQEDLCEAENIFDTVYDEMDSEIDDIEDLDIDVAYDYDMDILNTIDY